jgi:hypothetical protein
MGANLKMTETGGHAGKIGVAIARSAKRDLTSVLRGGLGAGFPDIL